MSLKKEEITQIFDAIKEDDTNFISLELFSELLVELEKVYNYYFFYLKFF